jgi:hypothetical protein
MPKQPRRPAELSKLVFLGTSPRARRLLTPENLRSKAWQRIHRGAYADAAIMPTHGLRCDAAQLVIPPTAAVGGRSAAWKYGVELLQTDDPVEIVVPPRHRFGPVTGMSIRITDLPTEDILADGPAITTPERTAWDIARFHPTPEAVAFLDAMVAARLVTISALQRRLDETTVKWGRKRVATALGLVDPRSGSPQESRLRAGLVLAGLPRPETQYAVHHRGRFVARLDLAWPQKRVAVEYDGVWHASAAQLHRDRRRLNQLVAAGWIVIHVTAVRLHEDFGAVVAEVQAALALR